MGTALPNSWYKTLAILQICFRIRLASDALHEFSSSSSWVFGIEGFVLRMNEMVAKNSDLSERSKLALS